MQGIAMLLILLADFVLDVPEEIVFLRI